MCNELTQVSMKHRVFDVVRTELLRVRRDQAPDFHAEIRMESSLITDLGLDSLSLVEAVVAIEEALHIERLSLDALRNSDSGREGDYFTVGSLVNLCLQQASGRIQA